MKRLFLGIAAMALTLSFSAFKEATQKSVTTDWYEPNGTISMTSADRLDHNNYLPTPLTSAPSEQDCEGVGNVCAAQFPDINDEPTSIFEKQ
ncbi:hypothetical protein [Pedobacter sp.]|uniref:hypothetical protein n=1 Tax=Pedobacter sp. TaxID=1411316 RepID=UPI003C5E654C